MVFGLMYRLGDGISDLGWKFISVAVHVESKWNAAHGKNNFNPFSVWNVITIDHLDVTIVPFVIFVFWNEIIIVSSLVPVSVSEIKRTSFCFCCGTF